MHSADRTETLRPTPVAISLTYLQWNNLKSVMEQMKEEFADVEVCWHDSQVDEQKCRECTPTPPFKETTV